MKVPYVVSIQIHFLLQVQKAIWNWIQKYRPQRVTSTKRRISEHVIDETLIKVGSEYIWLWMVIESKNREILALSTSKERNMFVAKRFIVGLVKTHGKHPVSPDGEHGIHKHAGFRIKHHIHSPLEKSIIERTMQYIKDRTEGFDDYCPLG